MLNVKNLSVKYGAAETRCALSNITFSVEEGERVALVGANGAGKSTLLLALTGVLPHCGGTVEMDGVTLDKHTLRIMRQRMGMVFQNPDDQLFMPTVYEDVAFGPRNYGHAEDGMDALVDGALEQLGIAHLKGRMSHQLSGGEKRLAALAGVLVMQPSILLMDEPTSFLDPRARRRLLSVLGALEQTMLISTHDLDMALQLCGRVILLKEGSLYADAPAESILRDAKALEACGL